MKIIAKPFQNYKWRWAEVTPSEGLNHPVRLLGVLRALYKHQGKPKSTNDIHADLEKIEAETNELTGEKVTLARTGERNLFRNSDRYWKCVGLLDGNSRNIELTPLGIKVAEGKVTQNEFAISVIKTFQLPNLAIETDISVSDWQKIGLEIKPLELILTIIKLLYENFGEKQAFLSTFELQKIVIPLAGNKVLIDDYITAISDFRNGSLNLALLPDCAPDANDKRMVRAFLLFLAHYGFLKLIKGSNNLNDQFFMLLDSFSEIQEIMDLPNEILTIDKVIQDIRENQIILNTERQKVLTKVLSRPQQAQFRKQVLTKFDNTCILTGERMNIVLEACHIIPVEHKGSDSFANGLCMRSDIHVLFDSKHIRFQPNGMVEYSDAIQRSVSYQQLPKNVKIPNFVSKEALSWRYNYY
ncbi:MAG: hypothetical protein RIS64_555 [Bacteroidota bacterium]|jgi:hypothetical protein